MGGQVVEVSFNVTSPWLTGPLEKVCVGGGAAGRAVEWTHKGLHYQSSRQVRCDLDIFQALGYRKIHHRFVR